MPVSTADVTRCKCTPPCSSTSASTTVAIKLPNDGCTLTPRPTRAVSGWPQLDFSATRLSAASRRGFFASIDRRKSTGSLLALRANSSMKHSVCEDIVVGTDAAPEPGRHRGRFGPHIFHVEVVNIIGHVDGATDGIDVDTFLEGGRQPARDDGRAGDAIFPADDLAVGQRRGNGVAIDRGVEIMLDVLFAGPHHLHRPVDLPGDANGGEHHVWVLAAAGNAAGQLGVDDLFLAQG